jgi:DNA mismatch repair protein MutH
VSWRAAPHDEAELLARARFLAGVSADALAAQLGRPPPVHGVRGKGSVGALIEYALGADGGPNATWDFTQLRVELKTIPLDARERPRESTFVCTMPLSGADRVEWKTSWVRAKLARILWIPIKTLEDGKRFIGDAQLWSPSPEQERVLADDFAEIVGRIGIGDIEGLSARVGRWLQLRPKAAHGSVRTPAPGPDGDPLSTVPRGFYLRAAFTGAILRTPDALPP